MRRILVSTFLSLVTLSGILFTGCGSHNYADQRRYSLSGQWTNEDNGAILLITEDGRFQLTSESGAVTFGRIERGGSALYLKVLRGNEPCASDTATYVFEAKMSTLELTVSGDDCAERSALLAGSWQLQLPSDSLLGK